MFHAKQYVEFGYQKMNLDYPLEKYSPYKYMSKYYLYTNESPGIRLPCGNQHSFKGFTIDKTFKSVFYTNPTTHFLLDPFI